MLFAGMVLVANSGIFVSYFEFTRNWNCSETAVCGIELLRELMLVWYNGDSSVVLSYCHLLSSTLPCCLSLSLKSEVTKNVQHCFYSEGTIDSVCKYAVRLCLHDTVSCCSLHITD